jgi:hypothetical protein
VTVKLINYGGRLGENIQCYLNIPRSYRISENVCANASLYAFGRRGEIKVQKHNF